MKAYLKYNDTGQICPEFSAFIKERIYLKNVSPRTVEWYQQSFAWLSKFPLTEDGMKDFVISMREAGLKPISCNNRIRVANAYFAWAGIPLKISRLKEEQKQLPTFSDRQVAAILAYKPKGRCQLRLHTLVCTMFDTGVRISEALALKRPDVDFDNMLLSVKGKGGKQRLVPFSMELRRILWRYTQKATTDLLFATRDGKPLGRRVVLRDFKLLCGRLGFTPPERSLHATRHTFASTYIKRGGSQFHLMKILGHSSLEMTKKYVNLQTEDLQAVHNGLSLLSR